LQYIYKFIIMEKQIEQIQLIEKMIANAKGNFSDSSIFYLMWGWLVVLAAAINYMLLNYSEYPYHWLPWPILMSLGGVASPIISGKISQKQKVKTYIDRALNYLWGGFGMALIAVLVAMVKIGPQTAYPILIFLYGLGTFVSGGILKFRPLILGGIACFLIGSFAVYADFSNQLILLALSIFVSYIIPGHLLAAKNKKHV